MTLDPGRFPRAPFGLPIVTLACLLLTGCFVSHSSKGQDESVNIGTPFGSMHVNTNDAVNTAAIGLSPYPGAVPVKDDKGKDKDSADVDMSFGSFHLGVKAATFQTSDPQDKVLDFYRKTLARYGDVIECRGHSSVGSPVRTSQGLTCDQDHKQVNISDDGQLELRAGSEQHQHIVSVESKDGGIRVSLVALDLPSHLSGHDSKDVE